MKLIKLNAIDSTNDYLKKISRNQLLDNFTVVTADCQTKGKGQMGSVWESEVGKNLIVSILIKDILVESNQIFDLNVAVAVAIFEVLEGYSVPNLSIKWPNDIMSDTKKIGGILIENSFKTDNRIESVVGIGLNVNQKEFSHLPKASSLALVLNSNLDLDIILQQIYFQIKKNCGLIISKKADMIWAKYHLNLFKIGIPMAFEDVNKVKFMGIIQTVSEDGLLQILLEDDRILSYGIKEIQLLY